MELRSSELTNKKKNEVKSLMCRVGTTNTNTFKKRGEYIQSIVNIKKKNRV